MATQKGRNWSSGDIVTAANLSSIERGVSAVAEEYTPTTWANGNTVTAAALNNIEQGLANASGSSDFSGANVTINNPELCAMSIAFAADDALQGVMALYESYWVGDYILPLYKGLNVIDCRRLDGDATMPTISVTGDATYTGGVYGATIFVRGDCTITVGSGSSGGGEVQ